MIFLIYKHLIGLAGPVTGQIQQFTSIRAIAAFITGFLFVLLVGPRVISDLYRRGFRDRPREYMEGFASSKAGTPTMGGIIITLGIVGAALTWCDLSCRSTPLLLLTTTFFAGLGAVDDVMKTKNRSSDGGLGRRFKLAAQGLFGLFFALIVLSEGSSPFLRGDGVDQRSQLFIPLISSALNFHPDLGLFWYGALILGTFLAVSNAVNFADGLDGLAVVPAAFAVAVYGVIAYMIGKSAFATDLGLTHYPWMSEVAIYCAGLLGAATGFLWFNGYPAQVFMGDTGSLALGGTLAALAVLTRQELLFLVVGFVFVYEFISVLIQETLGLQRLGRRLMYRAPAHHGFQHQGVAETKVVLRFWIVSLIFALIALGTLSTGSRLGGPRVNEGATSSADAPPPK